jgi:hypothetical protein
MFQFPGLPLTALFYSGGNTRALPRVGFPIRKSRDQRLVSTYPRLIAAAHVLHRLLAPRHPPCALVLLIEKNTCMPLWSFQGARGTLPAQPREAGQKNNGPVSQNSTACNAEVNVVLGEPEDRTKLPKERHRDSSGAYRSTRAPDSLERR